MKEFRIKRVLIEKRSESDSITQNAIKKLQNVPINLVNADELAGRENKDMDNQLPCKMDNTKHIPFYIPRNIRSVGPRINLDYNTTMRNDGNNVDIEKEIVDSAKNHMRYNAFITMMNNNFRIIKNAMRPV